MEKDHCRAEVWLWATAKWRILENTDAGRCEPAGNKNRNEIKTANYSLVSFTVGQKSLYLFGKNES